MPQLGVVDLKAPATYRADQVVLGPVGHDGHEVQAHRLLRPDVVEEYLVMAVRAHARRDLALILRTAWAEAEITTMRSLQPKRPVPGSSRAGDNGQALHARQARATSRAGTVDSNRTVAIM